LGQGVLGPLQAVGAFLPRSLRGPDLGNEGAALLRENLRRVLQFDAVALCLGNALIERGNLIAGALLAFGPAGSVSGKGRKPAIGKLGFADNGLLLRLHLGESRA